METGEIVGWRETCTMQGIPSRCSTWEKAVSIAFCSTSRYSCCKGVWVRRGGKPSITPKHPNRRNQVRQTGGTFTMIISVNEQTEGGN